MFLILKNARAGKRQKPVKKVLVKDASVHPSRYQKTTTTKCKSKSTNTDHGRYVKVGSRNFSSVNFIEMCQKTHKLACGMNGSPASRGF